METKVGNLPYPTSPRPVERFIADAKECGSPKGLRLQLQGYEEWKSFKKEHDITKFAGGFAAVAALSSLAPTLVTAAQKSSFVPAGVYAALEANVGSVIGAAAGISGIVLTAYALSLGNKNLAHFVGQKDSELERRFRPSFPTEPARAGLLMTRYSALNGAERNEVREALFDTYIHNKES